MNQKPKMRAIVDLGEASENATLRQYAKGLTIVLEWRGYAGPDLATLEGDVETYLGLAPKYDKRSAPLVADIARKGWKPATYKQYQANGRRMIEHATGALAARAARRAQQDNWAVLAARAGLLAEAGLIANQRLRGLARIADLARAMQLEPTGMTLFQVVAMKNRTRSENEWASAKRGARLLDELRRFPTLRALLPPEPIGEIDVKWRTTYEAPSHLRDETDTWVRAATTVLPIGVLTPEAHAMMTTEHSAGSKGVYAAALRSYVHVLGQHRNLDGVNGLASLFDRTSIETVLVRWISAHQQGRPGALSPRTIYRYADTLRVTLERQGQAEEAAVIASLCKTMPVLIEGRAANEYMSAETERWCRDLLADPDRTRIFETQHILYASIANEALEAAKAEKLDLVALADPAKMKRLMPKKRSRAKALLRRARTFGACAAAAAIELEGAPFRKANLLGLMRSGKDQTFFDVLHAEAPHYRILLPNEILKNGRSLTAKGRSMAPVHIENLGGSDYGIPILRWFEKYIRPLFLGFKDSHALFPAIDPKHPHLQAKTFDGWLLECSTEIGLPMTPHNYRHGVCSIQINDDPNCIEELAILLCDEPTTLRKYYAFLDRERSLRAMQAKRSERRAGYGRNRQLATALR